jgi:hydrogenase maturation protease
MRNTLVIGFGNPGRRDDGLGPALAAWLEGRDIPGVTVDSDYQLTVEDAEAVARHEVVVFVDAAVGGSEPFYFRRTHPCGSPGFSSHSVEPGEVLALAGALFGARPEAYVLGIRGYAFNEFGEGLSERAAANLAAARDFMDRVLRGDRCAASECGEPGIPAGPTAVEVALN